MYRFYYLGELVKEHECLLYLTGCDIPIITLLTFDELEFIVNDVILLKYKLENVPEQTKCTVINTGDLYGCTCTKDYSIEKQPEMCPLFQPSMFYALFDN